MLESSITILTPRQLLTMLRDVEELNATIVCDVRDEDRFPKWIDNSVNIPIGDINSDSIFDLVRQSQKSNTPAKRIVFHCQFSQVRGPQAANTCAQLFNSVRSGDPSQAQKEFGIDVASLPEVCLLEGGFQGFKSYLLNHGTADEMTLIVRAP